jgi:hypothetical protein
MAIGIEEMLTMEMRMPGSVLRNEELTRSGNNGDINQGNLNDGDDNIGDSNNGDRNVGDNNDGNDNRGNSKF